MKERHYSNRSVKVFFVIVIVLSIIVETVIIKGGPQWMYLILMWIPAMAALAANCINLRERGEEYGMLKLCREGGLKIAHPGYLLAAVVIPLVYLLIPYMFYWNKNPADFAYSGVALSRILADCALPAVLGSIFGMGSALGEELGWRGFMVPALTERIGLNRMLAVTSLFWGCWHLPILMFGDYMVGAVWWYKLPAFVLCIMPIGIITALLTIRSRSVWPAALLHSTHNYLDQGIFQLITRGDNMMYYVSETGVGTIICGWILAALVYVWFKRTAK